MKEIDITNLLVLTERAVVPVVLLWMVRQAWAFVAPHLATYLGEKNMLAFQQRFDLVAGHAIGYAVSEGSQHLMAGKPITIESQNWMSGSRSTTSCSTPRTWRRRPAS